MKTGCVYNITVGEMGFYIGSAKDFDKRLIKHNIDKKTSNYKLYKAIRENGGKFVMTKLYDVEYENTVELRIQERKCYDEMKPNLNMVRPYITKEEIKEYKKQYYIDNGDKIKERHNKYYLDNTDNIKERTKQWYNDNIDKIKKQTKQYKIDNADKIKERHNKYYLDNTDKIKERTKQYKIDNADKIKERENKKTTCDCGCEVNYRSLKIHQKTKKHLKLMAEKNVNLTTE